MGKRFGGASEGTRGPLGGLGGSVGFDLFGDLGGGFGGELVLDFLLRRGQFFAEAGDEFFEFWNGLHFAGPDGDHFPAGFAEFALHLGIAFFVFSQLLLPPLAAGFGNSEVFAVGVGVPEAAVDEDHGIPLGKDDVGFAGEGFVEGAGDGEAIAEAMEDGPHYDLGLGVARTNARHHP